MADIPLHGLDPRDLIREGFSALRGSGAVPWQPPSVEVLAPEFERYEILRLIGRGGMGAVFEARHRKLGKRVAVKLLPPEFGLDPEVARRFEAEGKVLATLQHPGVVAVYDSGETTAGSPYFVMEYREGEDLSVRMQRGRLPQAEAMNIIHAVAEAVAAAHAQGVLHRDLKPSNVLMDTDGRVRVADFGLAMVVGSPRDLPEEDSSPGQGTEAYAAPEQLACTAAPAPAADIYSLGVLTYELLTGSLPPSDLSGPLRAAGVDARYDAPLLRALQSDPAHRTASVSGFLQEIREASIGTHREAQTRRRLRRTRRLAGAMAALVAVASGMALVSWHRGKTIAQQRRDLAGLEKAARVKSALTDFSLANLHAAEGPASWPVAIAHLARAMRLDPENTLFGQRMYSLLSSYGWPEPLGNALQHAGPVRYAIFSPDGTKVATASDDGTARLWDAITTQHLGEPMQHNKGVHRLEFSRDGKNLLTVSEDNSARVWDARNGNAVTPPLIHSAQIYSARFDREGRRVVTASEDGTAQIWDAATGQRIGPALQHLKGVSSADFSPDGHRVLTASMDCQLGLWNSTSGQLITKSPVANLGYLTAQFDYDGVRTLDTLVNGITGMWRVDSGNAWHRLFGVNRTGHPLTTPEASRIPATISPNRLWLAAPVVSPGTAGVWRFDVDPPGFYSDVWRHGRKLTALEFSPNSAYLLTAGTDGMAKVWSVPSAGISHMPIRHGEVVYHAAWSPDGTYIVTASSDGTARSWLPHSAAQQQRSLPSPGSTEVWGVAASPDGRWLATGSNGREVIIWNAETLAKAGPVWNADHHVYTVQFTPDSKRILATRRHVDAQIWDIAENRVVRTLASPGHHHLTARMSPDGRYVATGGDSAAIIWDLQAPESTPPLVLKQPDDIHGVAWMPDSRRLITACGDGHVQMWDVKTGAAQAFSIIHSRDAYSCDVSPDGKWIATGSADWTTRVWDATTSQPVSEPVFHKASVNSVRFSPDGRRVVSFCNNGEAVVWDALTGQTLQDPLQHHAAGISATFTTDGRRILCAAKRSDALVWELGPDTNVPAPSWLPDAAEKLAGMKLDAQGRLVPVTDGWRELAAQWQHNDSQDPYAKLFRAILTPLAMNLIDLICQFGNFLRITPAGRGR